ncbi:MAG: AMP phosphorylase, partial [archaeon]|nr:AMP phosphorylase [archaeon]
IVTCCGLIMPKTSSRAITSPAGTADTIEVWCNVDQPIEKIRTIIDKTGGCFVWGGNLEIAPTDDKIIQGEYPLAIDPEGQLLASVMSKKAAMGAKAVVIDIPFGFECKVESFTRAKNLAERFKLLGKSLDLKVDCTVTRGEQPIGNGIGSVLECIDILSVLEGHGPKELREKSTELAGILLKLTKKGNKKTAEEVLDSGQALKKFKEIISAQDGNPDINLRNILGKCVKSIKAAKSGTVTRIYNKRLSRTARIAGAPKDKGAGIYMHVKLDDYVKEGDKLFDIYSEKKFKLDHAIKICMENFPVDVEDKGKIIVEEI